MSETVRVKYRFECPARYMGEMDIPKEFFDRLQADEEWSDEIEKFIAERHDDLMSPADTNPEFDADFSYVERVKPSAPGTASK
jgi:hypothetical protein